MTNKNILVTGGAGFIGSAVVRYIINSTDNRVLNIDKLTYAGNLESLASVNDNPRYQFLHADICYKVAMTKAFDDFKPDIIFQPIYYSNYILRTALFIKEYTGVPMIGYISDDCYTLKQFRLSPLYWIDRFHKRRKVKKVFLSCEFVYVISDIQKTE